jgi:hypothetical protein
MKTMTPMIAAKNMAGKEAVDSSMIQRVLAHVPTQCNILCKLLFLLACLRKWLPASPISAEGILQSLPPLACLSIRRIGDGVSGFGVVYGLERAGRDANDDLIF